MDPELRKRILDPSVSDFELYAEIIAKLNNEDNTELVDLLGVYRPKLLEYIFS
jgi:hypothetical protein